MTTPDSTDMFKRALAWFRSRGVDAVAVAGDLSDWGLLSGWKYTKTAWDAEMSGSGIVPLFITGNHDFEGWWYGDMTLDMHVQGYSEKEALSKLGMKKCWEETFGEPYEDIRHRKVRGFDFVSVEWNCREDAVLDWFKAHAGELAADRPVFFMRHPPFSGTTAGSGRGENWNRLREYLQTLPSCVAI
ncbi:MAG: metallophosphoesterase, partial [Kiritimatiellae bacterium]|nr:metallophosphoesterase [Kiritimatiellia bacterium]